MITLYDNPFSPFARKVRMALAYKGLAYASIDALALSERARLLAVNPRGEVPVLVDGEVTVVNSADIVAYLEHRYPDPPLLPADPALRVAARAWERCADGVLDAIIHDVSLWMWPTHRRGDTPPGGLVEAGRRDVERILAEVEAALDERDFVCGGLSVADLALFPHVSALNVLGMAPSPTDRPRLHAWRGRMRALAIVRQDLEHVKRAAFEKFAQGPSPYEGERVVWRGDRLEWLLGNGFTEWFHGEVAAGRVVVPRAL
jgi:glutathione S-transferase